MSKPQTPLPKSPPPRTLDVMQAALGSDQLVRPGELLEIRYRSGRGLSLLAGKLFHQLLEHAGTRVAANQQHEIPLAAINWAHLEKGALVEVIRELQQTIVEVELTTPKGKRATRSGLLISDVEREHDSDGYLRYEFSGTVRYVLQNSTHWGALSQRAMMAFESKYALRLYEILSLYVNRHQTSQSWALPDLRLLLGIEAPKFALWNDLRRFVIERAITEINHLSGFVVEAEPIKRGRSVTGVRFTWATKEASDRQAAKSELDQPRVGRAARRKGTVERITTERQERVEALKESIPKRPQIDDEIPY